MRVALLFAIVCTVGWAKPAPRFTARSIKGERIKMQEQLKEGRGLLVTFWASWCVPCIEELKHVKKHLSQNPKFPLDVLAVNVDTSETSTDVVPTMRMYGIEFPVVMDPKHEVFGRYHVEKTLPFSVLVDAKGNWKKTFNGYQPNMFEEIQKAL